MKCIREKFSFPEVSCLGHSEGGVTSIKNARSKSICVLHFGHWFVLHIWIFRLPLLGHLTLVVSTSQSSAAFYLKKCLNWRWFKDMRFFEVNPRNLPKFRGIPAFNVILLRRFWKQLNMQYAFSYKFWNSPGDIPLKWARSAPVCCKFMTRNCKCSFKNGPAHIFGTVVP
jgi:hypothetical protein